MNIIIPSVCFTGHRPKKLYGYRSYEDWQPLMNTIYNVCKTLYEKYNTRTFITGGAQGVDQTAFWAIKWLKKNHNDINNIVYVPMPGQESRWMKDGVFGQDDYFKMLDAADNYTILSQKPSVQALIDRNHAMVRDTKAVVAVWDGDKTGGTTECIKYADTMHRKIIHINPTTLKAVWLRK